MSAGASFGEAPAAEVYLARQPIFDRRLRVAGYELLFRGARSDLASGAHETSTWDGTGATTTLVHNALTVIGLQRIVGRHTAWINLSRAFLLDGLAGVLPSERTCFEVLENEVIDE